MRWRFILAVLVSACSPAATASVDPLTVDHADFVRHREAALWQGLLVERHAVTDARADWRIWRIVNRSRPAGPLWVVPHDNENAAFAAALVAVRRWGGVMVAVDSGSDDRTRAARYVLGSGGDRIDPNRAFTDAHPAYVQRMLADAPGRPIFALHTNAAGYDPALAGCGSEGHGAGSGGVSINLCNATYTPFPAPVARWPWDDADSVVIAPYLAADRPTDAWCAAPLLAAGVNVTFERVGSGDGSLSNDAAKRGRPYLNFETRERGTDAAGVRDARDRLLAMIAVAMDGCGTPAARLVAANEGATSGQ